MDGVVQWWLSLPMEMALAAVVYLLPLRHRQGFWLRVAASVVLMLLAGQSTRWLFAWGMPREAGFFLLYGLSVGMFYGCARVSIWDAVYGATSAYAVQHMGYCLWSCIQTGFGLPDLSAAEMTVYGAVLLWSYFAFARRMTIGGIYQCSRQQVMIGVGLVIGFAFFFSRVAELAYAQVPASRVLFLLCRLYAILCCWFVLYVQVSLRRNIYVQNELTTQKLLWEKERAQYELARDSAERINRKCHDLKHQLRLLRQMPENDSGREQFLRELEQSVADYDATVKTGNEVLDVVLTEKSLLCEREGIGLTCVANGASLAFMDPLDLYALFGNGLDNAIEAVRQVEEPDRRLITVTIYAKPGMAVLQIENYYSHALTFEGGLPQTTKKDRADHGYGLKNICAIVQRYQGSISIDTEDGIFLLCAVVPIPEQ